MKRLRPNPFAHRLLAAAAILPLMLGVARASLEDCIDATCRITHDDGGRGTGCVFERSQGYVYVLTAAHVVGDSRQVRCEFWRDGHPSQPLPAAVVARSPAADAAVVTLPESLFAGVLPKVIPVAPRGYVIAPGQTLTSVGCANGSWSTGWKGHALGYRDRDLHFVPTPANGRSGSAVFDARGEQIVGLLRARTGDDSEGIATSVQMLYKVFGNAEARMKNDEGTLAQCPGGTCPSPWRLSPYRERQDQQDDWQNNQIGRIQQVWPTLPGATAGQVDLGPTNRRLDGLTDKIDVLVEELRRVPPVPIAPPLPSPVDRAAIRATEEASQEAVAEVKQESSKLREAIGALIGDRETLQQRFETRLAKVKEELGEDAGRRDVARAYAKDLVQEKLSDGKLGLTGGKIIGGALGLSGPLALGIGVGLWFLSRRIGSKVESGDPLLVQRLFDRVTDRLDDLRDRVRNEPPAKNT
ncbi:MAG: trypsin-like peptidase domain-containing protein [Candidatus Nealsonbacteria bacterium]|nr:trypsin-like peptidase domain-containing protein [Candidatus Nealsonbacteria bacterium]